MKYEVDLSIIVPVYNTEQYIDVCLSSIKNQKYITYEVILINDGSSDGSSNLLKFWEKSDNRFRYIEQSNRGLSVARNTGIDLVRGKYIAFLDSDDWFYDDTCLQRMCSLAEEFNADVVAGNVLSVYSNCKSHLWDSKSSVFFSDKEIMSGKDFFSRMIRNNCYVPMVYNYIYRTSYIQTNNFTFFPNLIHEDELWTPQVLLSANKVVYSDIQHYCYRQREGSIMDITSVKRRIYSLKTIINELFKFSFRLNDQSKLCDEFYKNILRLHFIMSGLCISNNDFISVIDDLGIILSLKQFDSIDESVKLFYYKYLLKELKDRINTCQF